MRPGQMLTPARRSNKALCSNRCSKSGESTALDPPSSRFLCGPTASEAERRTRRDDAHRALGTTDGYSGPEPFGTTDGCSQGARVARTPQARACGGEGADGSGAGVPLVRFVPAQRSGLFVIRACRFRSSKSIVSLSTFVEFTAPPKVSCNAVARREVRPKCRLTSSRSPFCVGAGTQP